MGLLMLFGSFLSHEEFIGLLSILFHHPFGTTGSCLIPGSFFGSVWTSVFPAINLSPRKLLPFAVAVIPNHVLLCLVGTFISLYHRLRKVNPSTPGRKARDSQGLTLRGTFYPILNF
jgi:hypothetical protein